MMRLALLLALLPAAALADTLHVTWKNADQWTNGTQLAREDIGFTRVELGTCKLGAFDAHLLDAIRGGSDEWLDIPDVMSGTYCVRAFTNAKGTESAASDVFVSVVFALTDSAVFTLIKQRDALVMVPVGTAPVGTRCIREQNANGFYVVPHDAVTFSGSIKPEVVFGACS